eukprot:scaffold46870_cov79-Phaeocystis_antarctica.AAC.2
MSALKSAGEHHGRGERGRCKSGIDRGATRPTAEGWSWALGRGRTVRIGRPSVVWLCDPDGWSPLDGGACRSTTLYLPSPSPVSPRLLPLPLSILYKEIAARATRAGGAAGAHAPARSDAGASQYPHAQPADREKLLNQENRNVPPRRRPRARLACAERNGVGFFPTLPAVGRERCQGLGEPVWFVDERACGTHDYCIVVIALGKLQLRFDGVRVQYYRRRSH